MDVKFGDRLKAAQARNKFEVYSCQISDLQAIKMLAERKRIGKGELSAIAFAMRTNQAVITDDMKARRLTEELNVVPAQTTCHLFAWLLFKGDLDGADRDVVSEQHGSMGGNLGPHLLKAYEIAMLCKLNA